MRRRRGRLVRDERQIAYDPAADVAMHRSHVVPPTLLGGRSDDQVDLTRSADQVRFLVEEYNDLGECAPPHQLHAWVRFFFYTWRPAVDTTMKQYKLLEKRIKRGDLGAGIARWKCGRDLLAARGSAKQLPHGFAAKLHAKLDTG